MKLHIFSYRYAQEILQHPNNADAWKEIEDILSGAPIFIYPGKSKNPRLQIVQQLMNTYFDRRYTSRTGFAPPWFPGTTIQTGQTETTTTSAVRRTQWVATSSQ